MAEEVKSSKDQALDLLRAEIQRLNAELNDAKGNLRAAEAQVDELSQRNAAVIGEVRRIESTLDSTPRVSIKEAYSEALSTQQRLLQMRAQMDRLQFEQELTERNRELIDSLVDVLTSADGAEESLDPKEMIIRVIDAQEEERERLARMLHDGPAHALTNFILQAEICLKWLEKNPTRARDELMKLKQSANDAFQKVRTFISELRPMMLGDLGLVPTLKRFLEDVQNKSEMSTDFVLVGRERRLEEYIEVLLFRGTAALVTNARDQRNAHAVSVQLEMSEDSVRTIVEDDGRGFGTGRLKLDANSSETLGLGALQERVNLVHGMLQVDSGSGGAKISIELPAEYRE